MNADISHKISARAHPGGMPLGTQIAFAHTRPDSLKYGGIPRFDDFRRTF